MRDFDRKFAQTMADASEGDDDRHSRLLGMAIEEFFNERGCSVTNGPPMAYFETVAAGGAERRRYEYRVLAQGGWKGPTEGRGDGCDSFEDLRAIFLALLANWTKPSLPILVRTGPLVERHPETGKWYGYFRFVQLDFQVEELFVLWSLPPQPQPPRPDCAVGTAPKEKD